MPGLICSQHRLKRIYTHVKLICTHIGDCRAIQITIQRSWVSFQVYLRCTQVIASIDARRVRSQMVVPICWVGEARIPECVKHS